MTTEERIFNQAVKGTDYNKGLPNTLASLLIAQSKHETGNFTSSFFKKFNNAFGYSYFPGSNYQTGSIGPLADNGKPIADYWSLEDSVKEVIDWIYRRVNEGKFPKNLSDIKTPEQYAALLKSAGYYGDTLQNYTAGLKRFFIPVLEMIEKPAAGLGIAASLLLIWYAMKKRR